MMVRLLRRNALLPLRQITQTKLPFLFLNPISSEYLASCRTDRFPFPVFFFSSVASNLLPESPKIKEPVIDFFHSYGFTDPQIKRFIHKCPSFRSIEMIRLKLEHLLAFGFSPSDLIMTIWHDPSLLSTSLKKRIEPNLNLLEETIGSKTDIIKAIKNGPWLLRTDLEKIVIPNLMILRKNGIPTDNITRIFTAYSIILVNDSNVIIETIDKLKGMGMNPSTAAFVHGMNALTRMKKETWERKMEIYRSLGWSEKGTLSAFSRQPMCLQISDDKIKKNMKFFIEKLQWDSIMVLKMPVVLTLSIEKRIIPRCAVLNVLAKNGWWKGTPRLYTLFCVGEKNFKERFVDKYEKEMPQVIDAYQGKIDFLGFESMGG